MTAMNVHERTETAKLRVYEYLKTHKDVTAPELCTALDLTKNQVTHYIRFMLERGYAIKRVQQNRTKRFALYNVGRQEFKKKAKPALVNIVDTTVHVPHARVVKLTNLPYFSDLMPRKHRTSSVSIGSGMSMFSNWE
jgi:predicted ArsR family transcriptional regulator